MWGAPLFRVLCERAGVGGAWSQTSPRGAGPADTLSEQASASRCDGDQEILPIRTLFSGFIDQVPGHVRHQTGRSSFSFGAVPRRTGKEQGNPLREWSCPTQVKRTL